MRTGTPLLSSLTRALAMLEAIIAEGASRSVAAIARDLGVPVATAPPGRRTTAACKAAGASPHPFESDRRVQASLAQRTRAAGFYPAGRPFESVTRHQFTSPIAQMAERLAVNQEVRGSKPRRGANSV